MKKEVDIEDVKEGEADKEKDVKKKVVKPMVDPEHAENKLEWIRMIVYYKYSSATRAFDSYSSYKIGKSHIPYFDRHDVQDLKEALFTGSDGSVFWVSGPDMD